MYETEILENHTEEKNILLFTLYKGVFPAVARHVSKKGGSLEDARDIFHDALIIYYEKAKFTQASIHHSEQSYLLGIVKKLWIRKFKNDIRNTSLTGIEAMPDLAHTLSEEKPVPEKILRYLTKVGTKCMDLLQAFYYEKAPLEEIARRGNYSGIRSATVQKYKCLEKIRDLVKQKSMSYDDFLE